MLRVPGSGAGLILVMEDDAAGVLLIGFLAWFFFGPKKARQAELVGQVQQVQVTVKGGYAPPRFAGCRQ